MVVCYLRGVENTLTFLQLFATNSLDVLRIGRYTSKFYLIQPIERLGTLRIDVVGEVLRIHTRISGVFLLVETLDGVKRHFG